MFTDVSEAIVMIMEAVSTSETSVNFYQTTWPNNAEDSLLHNKYDGKSD
jgi:hypothetical protein